MSPRGTPQFPSNGGQDLMGRVSGCCRTARRVAARGADPHSPRRTWPSTMADASQLKYIEANLANTRDAMRLLVQYMTEGDFSFALVSDPHTRDHRIPHVPRDITVFHSREHPRVALLARAPTFDLWSRPSDASEPHFRSFSSPYRPLDPFLNELWQVFSDGLPRSYILGGDLNAKHVLWGPEPGDMRGAQLVQFVNANSLQILNSPASLPTFETSYARSWIDVTRASVSLASPGFTWLVSDRDNLSHHRYIEFTFFAATQNPERVLTTQEHRFSNPCGCIHRSRECATPHCHLGMRLIPRRNLRKAKSRGGRANAWWSPQLAEERLRARAMRRRFQRARDPDLRSFFLGQAKAAADRTLCQDLTARKLDGAPFKLAFAKLHPATLLPPLETSPECRHVIGVGVRLIAVARACRD
ncbi:hypothetical protein HPB49_006936 [Dermacentor silvarum]|uniref:Uncharacterized protein n=1 Tax=Dermacentor silvarum TaxID=543639 RepID=A0ACB8CQD4_DERSI|nr:hypothetical protein HPB49_006936 [Dermacentor silvarum]